MIISWHIIKTYRFEPLAKVSEERHDLKPARKETEKYLKGKSLDKPLNFITNSSINFQCFFFC